jgi:glycosyltransferase involved in cell wall biosynthesis
MIVTPSTYLRPPRRSLPALASSLSWADNLRTGLPAGIVFLANVYDGSEEAEENWTATLGLAQNQIPVQLAPIETSGDAECPLPGMVRKNLERLALQKVDPARSVIYQAGAPSSWNLDFYGLARVGRTAFGTDRIPHGWAERCNAMDEIWVPSEFNRETFTNSGVDAHKIRVLRTGVDTQSFRPGLQPLKIPHTRGFSFLSVTDGRRRCGTDVLLRAYLQEFRPDEDVALLLKISPRHDLADPEAEITFFIETELHTPVENTPTILLLNASVSHTDLARLYASASAFVLAPRGEAWGRACLEALASGLPVIATQWGAVSEFLSDANSFPVAVEGILPASCEDELVAGHRWAEPSVDHLRQRLREVFTNSRDVQTRAAQGRKDAVERWDWNQVLPQWVHEFRRLCESRKGTANHEGSENELQLSGTGG